MFKGAFVHLVIYTNTRMFKGAFVHMVIFKNLYMYSI